jgi:hypothetical protein
MPPGPKPHIIRPVLPWRDPVRALCGRDLRGVQGITLAEAQALIRAAVAEKWDPRPRQERLGAGAARWKIIIGGVVCLACHTRMWSCREWAASAISVMAEECDSPNWPAAPSGHRDGHLEAELQAVADLIAAHREEFAGLTDKHEAYRALKRLAGA